MWSFDYFDELLCKTKVIYYNFKFVVVCMDKY